MAGSHHFSNSKNNRGVVLPAGTYSARKFLTEEALPEFPKKAVVQRVFNPQRIIERKRRIARIGLLGMLRGS